MSGKDDLSPETRYVHTGQEQDPATGALTPPVYRAVTYQQGDPYHPTRYDYARSGNPTREALERAIADLEHGARGFAFSSGNQAITAALLLFSAGDHLIVTRDCQGGTQRLIRAVFSRFGLAVSYVDTDDPDAVQAAVRPNTRGVLVENFSNPFLRVTDIAQLSEWAHAHDLLVIVDNTFLTPVLQQPLDLGADIVLHSATKLISGHSDITAGLAVAREEEVGRRLYTVQNATGGILSPDDSYMVLRGLHTLPLRVRRAGESAQRIAEWLETRPEVTAVHYPGLADDPGHALAAAAMRGYGAIVTARLRDAAWPGAMAGQFRIIRTGAGFGGTETVISLPELHCHGALTQPERDERELTPEIIRISVGLEDPHDLIEDLRQTFSAVCG